MIRKYNPNSFLDNVNKHVEKELNKDRDKAIGSLISSLQQPAKELLRAIAEKQKKDVEELYKSLGWS